MKTLLTICVVLFFALTANFAPADGVWTTIDFPGAQKTQAVDADGDNIVGCYTVAGSNDQHGFLYNDKTISWTALDAPGAQGTKALGVSGANIVGSFYYPTGVSHGFIYNYKTNIWTIFDMPESAGNIGNTFPSGIDGNNIVGRCVILLLPSLAYKSVGFLYDRKTWKIIDGPESSESTATYPYAISGNYVVGYYTVNGWNGHHGFLYDYVAKTWTTLDFPEAVLTEAYGVSGNYVVGTYTGDGVHYHGFLYDCVAKKYTVIDFPGATYTTPSGISGGKVVGSFGYRGFIYTFQPAPTPTPKPTGVAVWSIYQ